jgi:hypothetical protein
MSRLKLIASIALVVVTAASAIIVVQKSLHFIGTAPFLSVDDSIPNVSVTLAERGRYGFVASPVQGDNEVDRSHAFFNYGPLYFWLGAAVTWVMGPSLVIFRMLHPIGLVLVVALAWWALRGISLAGPAAFAFLIFDLYLTTHWPIARPDIMVSICAALMVVFAGRAIERNESASWLAAGFFGGSALTTHQIAAVMVFVAAAIWLWAEVANWRSGRNDGRTLVRFAALVAGGILAGVVYLLAIDFRLQDLWRLGSTGVSANHAPFWQAIRGHFTYAWSSVDAGRFRWILAAYLGALALCAATLFRRGEGWRRVLIYVVPPFLTATGYQLGVSFYGNYHTGYAILSQVMTTWTVGALVSVAVVAFADRLGSAGRVFHVAVLLLAIAGMASADVRWRHLQGPWEQRVAGNVNMNDYVAQVLAPLPERARAWGSLYYGVTSGDRVDLIQFYEPLRVVYEDFGPDGRQSVAPDFLVLGEYEMNNDVVRYMAGAESLLEMFGRIFPGVRYRFAHGVYAPPYGLTREFERVTGGNVAELPPGIAVNDGSGRQWASAVSEPLPVTFAPSAPVTVNMSMYSLAPKRRALVSIASDLPPGFYLIDVALDRPDSSQLGVLMATEGTYFYWRGGWSDFSLPAFPYFPGDAHVELVVDHLGGPLFISRFENTPLVHSAVDEWGTPSPTTRVSLETRPALADLSGFGMRVTSVRAVVGGSEAAASAAVALTAPAAWQITAGEAIRVTRDGLKSRVTATVAAGVVLLQSPPIAVAAHQRYELAMPTTPASGAVEVGVIGSSGTWIAPPTLMPRRVGFDTGDSTSVTIAIQNSAIGRELPLDVSIGTPSLVRVGGQVQYVDWLMGCRSPYITPKATDCVR